MKFDPTDEYSHHFHSEEMIRDAVDAINDVNATPTKIRASAMILRDTASDIAAYFRLYSGRQRDISPEGIRRDKKLHGIFSALNPPWLDKASELSR